MKGNILAEPAEKTASNSNGCRPIFAIKSLQTFLKI